MSALEGSTTAQLEACRVSAAQQLAAALALERQQQQLAAQLGAANRSWGSRCRAAEAAAEKQAALLGHAEYECSKLHGELAAARREAANWRGRWEKDCSTGSCCGSSGINISTGSSSGGTGAVVAVAGLLGSSISGGSCDGGMPGTAGCNRAPSMVLTSGRMAWELRLTSGAAAPPVSKAAQLLQLLLPAPYECDAGV